MLLGGGCGGSHERGRGKGGSQEDHGDRRARSGGRAREPRSGRACARGRVARSGGCIERHAARGGRHRRCALRTGARECSLGPRPCRTAWQPTPPCAGGLAIACWLVRVCHTLSHGFCFRFFLWVSLFWPSAFALRRMAALDGVQSSWAASSCPSSLQETSSARSSRRRAYEPCSDHRESFLTAVPQTSVQHS